MGKSLDLPDLADRLVINTKGMDWVSRHATLRPYSRNHRFMALLKQRLSPDEWLHGECTGAKIESSRPICLWEYPHGQKNTIPPMRQTRMTEYFDELPKKLSVGYTIW